MSAVSGEFNFRHLPAIFNRSFDALLYYVHCVRLCVLCFVFAWSWAVETGQTTMATFKTLVAVNVCVATIIVSAAFFNVSSSLLAFTSSSSFSPFCLSSQNEAQTRANRQHHNNVVFSRLCPPYAMSYRSPFTPNSATPQWFQQPTFVSYPNVTLLSSNLLIIVLDVILHDDEGIASIFTAGTYSTWTNEQGQNPMWSNGADSLLVSQWNLTCHVQYATNHSSSPPVTLSDLYMNYAESSPAFLYAGGFSSYEKNKLACRYRPHSSISAIILSFNIRESPALIGNDVDGSKRIELLNQDLQLLSTLKIRLALCPYHVPAVHAGAFVKPIFQATDHMNLRAWFDYHRFLGVDYFYVFDRDGRHYPALRDLIEVGIVFYVYFPPLFAVGWHMYTDHMVTNAFAFLRARLHLEYVLSQDLDEFLVVPSILPTSEIGGASATDGRAGAREAVLAVARVRTCDNGFVCPSVIQKLASDYPVGFITWSQWVTPKPGFVPQSIRDRELLLHEQANALQPSIHDGTVDVFSDSQSVLPFYRMIYKHPREQGDAPKYMYKTRGTTFVDTHSSLTTRSAVTLPASVAFAMHFHDLNFGRTGLCCNEERATQFWKTSTRDLSVANVFRFAPFGNTRSDNLTKIT